MWVACRFFTVIFGANYYELFTNFWPITNHLRSINGFVGRAISETMQRDALELPGAGQTDPDTESKRAALLEKLQGVSAGDDSKE